jgi:crotonobetainyl-CoA:carnitine CoA-transferase CaiB-like acyl-CoA transferase
MVSKFKGEISVGLLLTFSKVQARGMVQTIDHPACGPIKVISPPVKYSNAEPSIRSPPPLLGEHTDELLQDLVGLSQECIEELKKKGVVA